MKKLSWAALLSALLFLLSSCGRGATYLYAEASHTHIYGHWYDVESVTCTHEGSQVRYCKICRAEELATVEIDPDIAFRAHDFTLTVHAPTECEEGYTEKQCQRCGYVVARADVLPPLYALLVTENTKITAPEGVTAAVMSDTLTHTLSYCTAQRTPVDAEVAFRLLICLTVTQAMEESSGLSAETPVTIQEGTLAGRTYTLGQLLSAFLKTGNRGCLYGFSAALGTDGTGFSKKVAERGEKLGLADSKLQPFEEAENKTTLLDTGTLLLRALSSPLLPEILKEGVPELCQVAGKKPALYLSDAAGKFRVSGFNTGDGVVFLLLFGESLPEDAEVYYYR